MNYIEQYWAEIVSGRIRVSKKVHRQYEKLIALLENKKYRFDEYEGSRPIEFIERFCRNVKGSNTLIKLELWEKALIQATYGFFEDTGYRLITEIHLYVGKKNGKSTLAACLGIYNLIADGEIGAEIVSGGWTRNQSKIIYSLAEAIIKKSPELKKRILCLATGIYVKDARENYFIAASKEADNFDGLNTSCFLCDELHNMRDRRTYEIFTRNTIQRKQPLIIITTTMGIIRGNIFDDIYDEDTKILDGVIDNPHKLVFCYELESREEADDEQNWQKANPMLGITIDIKKLRQEWADTKEDMKKRTDMLCKNFNIRMTDSISWLSFDVIKNPKTFDFSKYKNCYAIGGVDLSRTNDLTAWNTLVYDKESKEFCCKTMYWITKELYSQQTQLGDIYRQWVEMGYMRVCQNSVDIDYRDIIEYVNELIEQGIIFAWVYYDSYSAKPLIDGLEQIGFSQDRSLIRCIQGFKTLSVPMQKLEATMKEKRLNYDNNPITEWCFTNVELVSDRNDNQMPNKANRNRKIDGVAVILNCFVGLCDHYQEFIDLY